MQITAIVVVLAFLIIPLLIDCYSTYKKSMQNKDIPQLKYIDFSPDRINFKFNQQGVEFSCSPANIKDLNLYLETEIRETPWTIRQIVVERIKINILLTNNQGYTLSCKPFFKTKFLYKFVDSVRNIPSFSYKFVGVEIEPKLNKQLESYIKKGYKQRLTTGQERAFRACSIIFFISAFYIFFNSQEFLDTINLIVASIPIIISFIFDFILILDKTNDKNFNIRHKSSGTSIPISPQAFLLLKLLILAIFAIYLATTDITTNFVTSTRDIENYANIQNIIPEHIEETKSENVDEKYVIPDENGEKIYINPPCSYNNMSKSQILKLRKYYMKKSIFWNNNYEPNEDVFGGIEDYKPWWGDIKCISLDNNADPNENIRGKSHLSSQINNPTALVGLKDVYVMYNRGDSDFCTSNYAKFIPKSIKYNKEKNLIIVEYPVSRGFLRTFVQVNNNKKRYPLQLCGLNARDLGYNYIYANELHNIQMSQPNNSIAENYGRFLDYIHVGGSCKLAGGCNNISPIQEDKMITVQELPAAIDLKLWKEEPINTRQKADINYRIVFKEQSTIAE
jgi:hypothetical protein